jgi:ribosomal protein S18 acetylase RimI-like enzyme
MITIQKLSPDDWQQYRDIRLMALKDDPHAFGSSYEEEVGQTELDWRNRIGVMWFALDAGEVVGLIGLLQRENQSSKHCGYVISMWVRPHFRGQGIAKSLLKKLQKVAPTLGLKKLSLQVTVTQTAAFGLYQDLGFKTVGLLKNNLLKDGQYFDEYLMEWLDDSLSS